MNSGDHTGMRSGKVDWALGTALASWFALVAELDALGVDPALLLVPVEFISGFGLSGRGTTIVGVAFSFSFEMGVGVLGMNCTINSSGAGETDFTSWAALTAKLDALDVDPVSLALPVGFISGVVFSMDG